MPKQSGYSRREFLKIGSTLPLLSVYNVSGCGDDAGGGSSLPQYEYSGAPGPADLFQHGVASGDPLADAVILWTRVTPAGDEPVEVFWEMATDPGFQSRIAADWTATDAMRDFTVKLDVGGLQPGTTYYYRFRTLGRASIIGRTRSLPIGPVDRIRLGLVACSSLAHGYFHGYRELAQRADLDAVLHVGDYIYEYGTGQYGTIREYEPAHEILSLADYRTRYSQYRRDPDLQAAHQQFPFINVWDDHEVANDAWRGGAQNHTDPDADGPNEGPYDLRREAARRAFSEWLPIRDQPNGQIFRSFSFGDLLDLIMLDTRHQDRDRQVPATDRDGIHDPERTLLGFEQESWFETQIEAASAHWRFIGQQVVFGNIQRAGTIFNPDQWDGYDAARRRLLEAIQEIRNVVVLSGDLHSSGATELSPDPYDPAMYDPETGAGSLAVEFVTPGITSPAFPAGGNQSFLPAILADNPHIRFADIENRGYTVIDADRERVQATWYHYSQAQIEAREASQSTGPTFAVFDGTTTLVELDQPAAPPDDPPDLAPA